jgi:predicted metal-dependent phosphoesterase TrpH
MTETGRIDLHLHSTASDGRLGPVELVELAHRNGVRRMALTDHDTTAGLAAASAAARRLGMEIIPGIEVSTDIPGSEIHMIGLFLDHEQQAFQEMLSAFRAGRLGRAEGMVQRLGELGVPVSWERVLEIAGDASVGRPHVAQALLEAGHISQISEAFDRFIGRNGPAYVERMKLTPAEAIELIHSVRGVAILAHPLFTDDIERIIPELARAGLDGVECYYPSHSPSDVEHVLAMARSSGLLPSGGSDYHGFPMAELKEASNEPGSVAMPPDLLDQLWARRQQLFGS